jgi:hypothetical protein
MPAGKLDTALDFGIKSHGGAFIETIDLDATVEVAELLNSQGGVGRAHPYKEMAKGSVKGHDTITVVPGVGDSGVDGVEGGLTIITSLKTGEKNTEHNGWEYSFNHYPDAASGN